MMQIMQMYITLYDSDSASGSSDDMADEGNIFTQSKYVDDIIEDWQPKWNSY